MPSQLSTDEHVDLPWRRDSVPPAPPVLHLVVAWFLGEAGRIGHSGRVDVPCWFGRGAMVANESWPVSLYEDRPGAARPSPPIETTALSRRQLVFDPEGECAVRVQSTGRRRLFHNGVPAERCVARAGDTLMLENTAVFLLDERPKSLPLLRHYPAPDFPFGAPDPDYMVGESPAAWRLREDLAAAASGSGHVLLLGESGAGKELAARAIHRLGPTASGPFIARNAATLPPGLVDAELFGTAKNYPNPGTSERAGLVGAADGGTLFLDEIAELPLEHQAHLLRILDSEGEYHRLGETHVRKSRFRLVGATNREPGSLKHDLLARLTTRVRVPGLGDRRSDVPFLLRELLARAADAAPAAGRFFDQGVARLDPVLVELLLRRRYTHHARELARLIDVSVATSPGEYLAATPEFLAEIAAGAASADDASAIAIAAERQRVQDALAAAGGNIGKAAERLDVSRHAFRRLMQKHGLERD